MDFQSIRVTLNRDKSIGKVLYIVEGGKTEPYIIGNIFTKIFDYQCETLLRSNGYHKYNSKENPYSQVFIINAEESNIKNIAKDNEFLTGLFQQLINEYDFDVDNAAIYYIFDRDNQSNVDKDFIENMLSVLVNSRDNPGYDRQGMLLLSYPAIESFTISNFEENTFDLKFAIGHDVKRYAFGHNINHQKISGDTLVHSVEELILALKKIGIAELNLDDMEQDNKAVYDYEESEYCESSTYIVLSLLAVSLMDLGLIEVNEIPEQNQLPITESEE